MNTGNFFESATPPASGETFEVLLRRRNLEIERIISSAAIETKEYVQDQDEWVMLVQGKAELLVDDTSYSLQAGDYLFIPAGTKHRVQRVDEGSLWLAVHLYVSAL